MMFWNKRLIYDLAKLRTSYADGLLYYLIKEDIDSSWIIF